MPVRRPQKRLTALPVKGLPEEYIDCFVAREEVMDTINLSLRELVENGHQGLRFEGERGIGKSAIYDFIEKQLVTRLSIVPIQINTTNIKYGTQLLGKIIRNIREKAKSDYGLYKIQRVGWWITDHISEFGTAWITIKQKDETNLETKKEKYINELKKLYSDLSGAGVNGILIMLDDVDELSINILGEIGQIFNRDLIGFTVYISSGNNIGERVVFLETDGVPSITDTASGNLAYWERVPLAPFTEEELIDLLDNLLVSFPNIEIDDNDKALLFALSGGNGRLFSRLLSFSSRFGIENAKDKNILHITREVVNRVLEADERLAIKLRATLARLEKLDPKALKSKWW